MLRQQAHQVNSKEILAQMDLVLRKFHLAVYKEIKYTDYRSAFTEMQLYFLDNRETTRQE